MRRNGFIFVGILFFAAAVSYGQTTGEAPFQRLTAPQVVAGGGVVSDIVLLNTASTVCTLGINYHVGNGQPPDRTLFTNGQNLGNSLLDAIAGLGTRSLQITTVGTGMFEGAVSVDVLDPFCFNRIDLQTQYRIVNNNNELQELFSYPIPSPVPLNSCAEAPVSYDPDPVVDDETTIPGLATVSLEPLNQVIRTMTLFDSEGNEIATAAPQTYNGAHVSGLLNDFFPDQEPFRGSWRVCFEGQRSPSATTTPVIDTLFINVLQTPGIIQFDSNQHSLVNPGCRPDDRTLCLDNNRFRVQVNWSQPPQLDEPGFVQNVQPDDSGFFFFLDPSNTEFIVKVLDGCSFNDHFWVFYGATTNVEFTMTVTDTLVGETREFRNPLNQPADPIVDTQAFATCP